MTRRVLGASVRARVTAAATLAGLLGALLGASLFLHALDNSLDQALISSARQETADIARQLGAGETPEEVAVSAGQDRVVQVLDARGAVVASDVTGTTRPLTTAPGVRRGVRAPGADDVYTVHARRLADGGLVAVGLSQEQRSRSHQVALHLLLGAVPLAVALLALAVWTAVGRALVPVEAMRREADRISSEHLHRRLPTSGDDEISQLARTLNEMLDRIDLAHRSQRRFVSDASHELRTPLAILRQSVEVAARHPSSTTVEELASGVAEEQRRMEELVAALLTLARLDDAPTPRAIVDLDDVVLREAARIRRRWPDVVLDLGRVSAGQVRGDEVLLGQVVTNLLANAARHARTEVQVHLREDDEVVLVVEDDGDGIAPADRERVFERFARLDDARARDHGGSGLGLSIVASVVLAHDGTVTVGETAGGGARFEVRLPHAAR